MFLFQAIKKEVTPTPLTGTEMDPGALLWSFLVITYSKNAIWPVLNYPHCNQVHQYKCNLYAYKYIIEVCYCLILTVSHMSNDI